MKKIVKIFLLSLIIAVALSGCLNGNNTDSTADTGGKKGQMTDTGGIAKSSLWLGSKNTTRINTSDPIQAAVLVSQTLWMSTSDMNRPDGVVLVNQQDWQTTLVSADLIHFPNNGPILFVNNDSIPEATQNELKRLNPTGSNNGVQVVIVGNIDQKVEAQVKSLGFKTDKITGGNPAAIAKAIDAYYTKVSQSNPQSVIVGSMDSQEYTLPAINWISHMPEPLLYVKKDEIPQETIDALRTRNGMANIYIIGPESVVSAEVQRQLGQYGKVVRIAGQDPYDNAIAFAKYKDPATGFGWGITTSGHNFSLVNKSNPELALAAAPFSHLGKHSPLLWTDKEKMPDSVMTYIMSVQPKYKESPTEGPYNHAWLTGSTDSITVAAQGEIDAMLEIVSESGEVHGGHGSGTTPRTPAQPENGMTGDMPGMKH